MCPPREARSAGVLPTMILVNVTVTTLYGSDRYVHHNQDGSRVRRDVSREQGAVAVDGLEQADGDHVREDG